MLRTERSSVPIDAQDAYGHSGTVRQLLLAVAPPPHPHHSYALSGWPSWLVPTFRAGAHRPPVRAVPEER